MASLLYLMSFLGDPPPAGESFEVDFEGNLHLTVLSNFQIPDHSMVEFRATVRAIVPWFPNLAVRSKELTRLGSYKEIDAALVEDVTPSERGLKELHKTILVAGSTFAMRMKYPEYAGENFNPHISYLTELGKRIPLRTLSLVSHANGFGEGVVCLENFTLPTS